MFVFAFRLVLICLFGCALCLIVCRWLVASAVVCVWCCWVAVGFGGFGCCRWLGGDFGFGFGLCLALVLVSCWFGVLTDYFGV